MQQAEEADAHGKKEQGLAQLEGRDEDEARIVPPVRRGEPGLGVSHGYGEFRATLLPVSTLTDARRFCCSRGRKQ